MALAVTFLGTGGSVPNKFRNLPSVLLRTGPDLLLFDCGEGTQRQFLQTKAGMNRKMRIFISHLHGDHVFGLPGMLHSLAFMGRTRELEIFGPKGIKQLVASINDIVRFNSTQFPLTIKEVRAGQIVNDDEYVVRAAVANHGIPCFAYAFEQKPRPGRFDPRIAKRLGIPEGPLWKKLQSSKSVKIGGKTIHSRLVVGPPRRGLKLTYAVDTRPCLNVVKLGRKSDLLIHDSTFDEAAAIKARAYGHSTSTEAARIAKRCNAKKLALFHISAKYENATPLLIQARKVFRQSFLAKDMETIYVS
jgi:ribonuclease Z